MTSDELKAAQVHARDALSIRQLDTNRVEVYLGRRPDLLAMMRGEAVTGAGGGALAEVEIALAPRRRAGLGVLTHAERVAVEQRAVEVACEFLAGIGYDRIEDVGARESYDLDARRGSERLYVEVKGTTTEGERVVLTRNEVALHRSLYPATMLIVVYGIQLDRTTAAPRASGGELRALCPWVVEDTALEPLAFSYTVPNSR